ncbi:hypothetical protein BH09ACT1_BH09ACT1_05900 [soil metagenome]
MLRRIPWWVSVIAIWAVSRLITTALLALFSSWQAANSWTAAHPGYLAYSQLWDSTWYHLVAVSGYPSVLPTGADGHVSENAWAFLPAYPWLVRVLMLATGQSWELVSVLVSLLFSLAAALVVYRLMRLSLPAKSALFAVVLFCVAPLSAILQVSYAESMYVFLLALALYLLVRRRYGWLFPVVLVMSFTRPSGLAFALALGIHIVHRFVIRGKDAFPPVERVLAITLAAFSVVTGFAWNAIAALVTGVPSAYTATELAWREPYIGYTTLRPFSAWFEAAGFWAVEWRLGWLTYVLLVAMVVLFAALFFVPTVRRLSVDLRIWCASYGIYLLAVFFPQSSVFRLLIPLFPLVGALAVPRSRAYRAGVVGVMLAGQFGWLYLCWWVNGYDWTPP